MYRIPQTFGQRRALDRRRLLAGLGAGAGLGLAGGLGLPRFGGGAARAQSDVSGTVRFWHVWGGDREPLIAEVLANFAADFPNITVEPTLMSQDGLQEKYLTAIAGGDPPDVMQLHTRDLPNFASRGALRGVEDLIARDQIDVDGTFYPAEAQVSRFEDQLYGLPLAVGGGNFLIYWNKDHFRDAGLDPDHGPETWTELVEFSKALTKGTPGNFEQIGSLYTGNPSPRPGWFMQWATVNGGRLYSDDGRTVTFNAPENVAALEWIVTSLDETYGGWENVRTYLAGSSGAEGNQAFFQGQISIHLQGIYHFLQLSVEAPDLDYGVTIPPYNDANPDSKPAVYVDGNWNYMLPTGGENVDASWELVKYLCLGDGQRDFFMPQGRPSVVPAFNEDPAYQEANPHWSVVQEVLTLSQASPVTAVYAEDTAILAQYVEEAYLKRRTPEEALNLATEEAQSIHDMKLG